MALLIGNLLAAVFGIVKRHRHHRRDEQFAARYANGNLSAGACHLRLYKGHGNRLPKSRAVGNARNPTGNLTILDNQMTL